jgi:hypothetical protein
MTPEQITLVQSSYDRLGPDYSELAARFYVELFARDPDLRRARIVTLTTRNASTAMPAAIRNPREIPTASAWWSMTAGTAPPDLPAGSA